MKIIVEGKLEAVDLADYLDGQRSIPAAAPHQGREREGAVAIDPAAALADFLQDRIRYYFKDIRGFAYDEVNAAMAAGWSRLVDLDQRLSRVQMLRPTPDFEPLAASFKRIRNILQQADFHEAGTVDETLLEAGPEQRALRRVPAHRRPTHRKRDLAPAAQSGSVLRQSSSERAGCSRPAQPIDAAQYTPGGVFQDGGFFGNRYPFIGEIQTHEQIRL